ncbi:MAG: non-canonical purine NTP pyrophosphatase, partial [Nitrososphaerales archaeon]
VLRRFPSKGPELQSGDPSEVAVHAAAEVFQTARKPLFVEDTGLFIECLRGFPGTSASFAFTTLGLDGILKLMDGMSARGAEFVSAVAYCDGSSGPRSFTGRLMGRMALRPLGQGGFGFDPIFVPTGRRRTMAQLTFAEKCAISHRAIALRDFGRWLSMNRSG